MTREPSPLPADAQTGLAHRVLSDPQVGRLLTELPDQRRAHSVAVAVKAAQAGPGVVPVEVVPELVTAAALHDIGYADPWVRVGFHPIDGARQLQALGYPPRVCAVVAHHTGAWHEAVERGLDMFEPFTDVDPVLLSVVSWADLTTGPTGLPVSAADRVAEILHRYPPDSPVHRNTRRRHDWLLAAGAEPLGSVRAAGSRG